MSGEGLKVLFLAAEAVPFAKVGGLADVAGALPKALRALGHDVRLMIPRYGSIRSDQFHFERVGKPFPVPVGPREEPVHLVTTTIDGMPVYLIWDEKFFSPRDRIYGFDDDPQRFTFFCRAAVAALPALGWMPDILHANDWHTDPVPTWLAYEGRYRPEYRHIASVFTIHNIAYQGPCGRLILTFARMEYVKHLEVEPPGQVNWMAQGIANADLITTVSPQYAREILETEAGAGLSPLLRQRQDRLFGILNGIDTDFWNPATDPHLRQKFDLTNPRLRAVNKAALQQEARLPVRPDIPLIGMVVARVICEAGMFIYSSPFRLNEMIFRVAGSHRIGAQNITLMTAASWVQVRSTATQFMPQAFQGLKLSSRQNAADDGTGHCGRDPHFTCHLPVCDLHVGRPEARMVAQREFARDHQEPGFFHPQPHRNAHRRLGIHGRRRADHHLPGVHAPAVSVVAFPSRRFHRLAWLAGGTLLDVDPAGLADENRRAALLRFQGFRLAEAGSFRLHPGNLLHPDLLAGLPLLHRRPAVADRVTAVAQVSWRHWPYGNAGRREDG